MPIKTSGKIQKFIVLILIICLQIMICPNFAQASDAASAALSPELAVLKPELQAVFLKTLSNSVENIHFFDTDAGQKTEGRKTPGISNSIKTPDNYGRVLSLAVNSIKALKVKWSVYWNYNRPLSKKFRVLGFRSREIKPVLKKLLKTENIYIAKIEASALYNLAKYLLADNLGFTRPQVLDLLDELAGQSKVRRTLHVCFDIIELLLKEGFDGTDIRKIISAREGNSNIEAHLEQVRYRVKKTSGLQIDSGRRKQALIEQDYFKQLMSEQINEAQKKARDMFERIKQVTQEPIELSPRVMGINVHALLTSRASAAQIYEWTLQEINYIKRLLSARLKASEEQEALIKQTNIQMSNFLNLFGLVFEPYPVYFVPNESMPYLTDGMFFPDYRVVASKAEISPKALYYELIHEGLHANAHGFISTRLNEGMTELWRNKLMMLASGEELTYEKIIEHHYENFTDRYIPDLKVILLFLYNFGEEALFNAYFYGDNRALEGILGPLVREEFLELAVAYENADELKLKEYPVKAEKLLRKYFPDLKTFAAEKDEKAVLNCILPEFKIRAQGRDENTPAAIAARLKGSIIYPFDSRNKVFDLDAGYALEAELSEHNPNRVKIFLVRQTDGQRSNEPVLFFKADGQQLKALAINLEQISFSDQGANKTEEYLADKKMGTQLMFLLGEAVSEGVKLNGRIINEQTREELAAACYVDLSGKVRIKKVWKELAGVKAKERILFLTSPVYGARDEAADFFIIDEGIDLPDVSDKQKIYLTDILSQTLIGKLNEAGGFFKHSLSKILFDNAQKIKQRLSGVQALRFMLNNLERNEFRIVLGDMTPSFTLISEKTGAGRRRDIQGQDSSFSVEGLITKKEQPLSAVLEQAI